MIILVNFVSVSKLCIKENKEKRFANTEEAMFIICQLEYKLANSEAHFVM